MPEGLMISFEDVSAAAGTIAGTNEQLTDRLNQISIVMANLSATWQSEAAETIRGKMESMKPKFENYREIIDSYVKFLNKTVSTYTEAETAINAAASAFQ